jgi:dTDP-4-dehydrorhamnose reductase
MIRTILVTGPNGQLGFELVRTLACVGRVQTVGRNDVDLSDLDAVRRHVRALRPDIIVNAAAYTNVDRAESEHLLAERINGELPQVLAGELRQYGGQLMVHYSTDYVFDGSATQPWREDAPTSPLNAYGRSKLLGEQALQRSGVPHLVLRTSWIFATRGSNFLLTILRLAREGKPLRIISDQVGAPTWARILAETTALMIPLWLKFSQAERAAVSGVYHATAAGQTTWHGFTEQILQEYLCRLRATNRLSD